MNYKNWYKLIIFFVLVALVVILQVTFLGNLNSVLKNFNLALVLLVLLIGLADFKITLIYSVLVGILLDIYSSSPFGIFLITFFVIAVVLEILFLNFFTNRSFYSLVLMGIIAVAVYNASFLLISGLLYLMGISDFFMAGRLLINIFYQLIGVTLILSLAFSIINKTSKRFKPIFFQT